MRSQQRSYPPSLKTYINPFLQTTQLVVQKRTRTSFLASIETSWILGFLSFEMYCLFMLKYVHSKSMLAQTISNKSPEPSRDQPTNVHFSDILVHQSFCKSNTNVTHTHYNGYGKNLISAIGEEVMDDLVPREEPCEVEIQGVTIVKSLQMCS